MGARRWLLRALVLVCASAGVASCSGASALGAVGLPESFRFGGGVDETTGGSRCPENPGDTCISGAHGSGAGQLNEPSGVGIDQATGDVYVADRENDRVDRYGPEGAFLGAFGLNVGGSGVNVCTTSCSAGTASAAASGMEKPTGVAVDQASGDVYVVDWAHQRIEKFDSAGNFILMFGGGVDATTGGNVCPENPGDSCQAGAEGIASGQFKLSHGGDYIAVGPAGDVYVGDENRVQVFEPSGKALTQIELPGWGQTTQLAVDGSGDIYAMTISGNFTGVHEYSPLGVEVSTPFDPDSGSPFDPIALDASGNLYVDDTSQGKIFIYNQSRVELGSAGSAGEAIGMAYGETAGILYASSFSQNDVKAFAKLVEPDVATGAVSVIRQTGVTLNGTVDPDGVQLTTCEFEYGTTTAYGQSAPCVPAASAISADANEHAVTASVTGLARGTTYHFRLVAGNAQAGNDGADRTFTTVGPVIDETSALSSHGTDATLTARIAPLGHTTYPTTYHFEYGTSTSYGASVPVSDADIGAGEAPVTVEQEIAGLQPDTTYHVRVVATNSFGSVDGPDAVFATAALATSGQCPNESARTGPSLVLPDCRAFEQVTPVDKGSSEDMFGITEGPNDSLFADTFGVPSEDGERYLLDTYASLNGESASGANVYLFTRSPSGWGMRTVGAGQPGVNTIQTSLVSSGLDRIGFLDLVGSEAGGKPKPEYFAGPVGGSYASLPEGATPLEASAGLGQIVLQSKEHELAGPGSGSGLDPRTKALYEWDEGSLSLVNVETDGSLVSRCGAGLGNAMAGRWLSGHAVSADGSKVFFTAPEPQQLGTGCWNPSASPEENPPELYVREAQDSTVEVSAPQAGVVDPTGNHPAVFVGASADGSKVFFVSQQELTSDDLGMHAPELYEYDSEAPEGHRLTRISHGESGTAEGSVDFVPAMSEDGSVVYFTAQGHLSAGAPPRENEHVYLYRYDANTGKTSYVAEVGRGDYPLLPLEVAGQNWWDRSSVDGLSIYASELGLDERSEWYTTPDGQYLVFATNQPITGFHTHAVSTNTCERLYPLDFHKRQCIELYRYSASAQAHGEPPVVCVSCVGGPPTDDVEFNGADLVGSHALLRPISNDGEYVVFQTASALVAGAVPGVEHVYEWHNGTVSLLSPANDASSSSFQGMSADGSDVFIGTHAQLVAQDTDTYGDLYDARIDGGVSAVAPAACTGTGCQGVPSAPPIFATPSSVTFNGVGNFPPSVTTAVKPRAKGSTRTQKLKAALKRCKRDRAKQRRSSCQKRARAKYGSGKTSKANGRGK